VGTEILVGGQPHAAWEALLDEGWDREVAAAVAGRFPELVMQQASEQRPHKVSYKLYAAGAAQAAGVVSNLRAQLSGASLEAAVVFSGGEDLDVLPARASKGKALAFLLQQMEAQGGAGGARGGAREVLVAGDSGNDVELFAVPGVRGCVVANAHAELREWCAAAGAGDRVLEATRDGAGGIREALHHFGLAAARAEGGGEAPAAGRGAGALRRRRAVVALHLAFERWFNDVEEEEEEEEGTEDLEDLGPLQDAPAELAASMGEGFELVGPGGTVTSGADLLRWFRDKGRGSRGPGAGAAAHSDDPLAPALRGSLQGGGGGSGVVGTPTSADSVDGGGAFEGGGAGGGLHRIWIDRYADHEVAPGVWVARYMELQQRFPPAEGEAGGRKGRWSSAVLREDAGGGGGSYKWMHVHETWVPCAEAVA
jgi:sucrose-6F-phosphate phosphohydrolase